MEKELRLISGSDFTLIPHPAVLLTRAWQGQISFLTPPPQWSSAPSCPPVHPHKILCIWHGGLRCAVGTKDGDRDLGAERHLQGLMLPLCDLPSPIHTLRCAPAVPKPMLMATGHNSSHSVISKQRHHPFPGAQCRSPAYWHQEVLCSCPPWCLRSQQLPSLPPLPLPPLCSLAPPV